MRFLINSKDIILKLKGLKQETSCSCLFDNYGTKSRRGRPEVFCKKSDLKNFAKLIRKHLCQELFLKLAQVFYCEFCEIYKNTFFYRTPLVAASANLHFIDVKIVSGDHKKKQGRECLQECLRIYMIFNKTVI